MKKLFTGTMSILMLMAMLGSMCNGLQEGLEYHYRYSTRLTAGLREVGRQEASSALKADITMQVQTTEEVTVKLSNIMVGDVNGEPLKCREPGQDFQGIEYRPLEGDSVNLLEMPFKINIRKGQVININVPENEHYWYTNIRRSIAFIFTLPSVNLFFPDSENVFSQDPYFNEYEYSPFGECLTRFSLTPIMEELKLKEKLSIEEDIQFGDSSPASLVKGSQKGQKGRTSSKTRKGSKGAKGSKGGKGSKPAGALVYDAAPKLADKLWRFTRSIDFDQCLDLVQLHTPGIQMVGTKESLDDCGEKHFSRSHDGTFILHGDAEGLRLEKAEVQGIYTVDAIGTNQEHITSFAIQSINLISVRLIETEINADNEESSYVDTQFRHELTHIVNPLSTKGMEKRIIDSMYVDTQYKEKFYHIETPMPTPTPAMVEQRIQRTVTEIQEIFKNLPTGKTTHIVGDLNAMAQNFNVFSKDDLQNIYDQLTDTERNIFFKVLTVSGFETPYEFLFEQWSQRGTVSKDVIFNFIMNMANNLKGSFITRVVQDMVLNAIEDKYLRGLALMNYAHLASRFCLNPCGYKNHIDYECTGRGDCKWAIKAVFIPWIKQKLYSEETFLWERLMYLQTLANLHTEEIIPVVLPFITDVPMAWADDEPINLRLRVGAIYALRKENMPANVKKQVFSILMALFENQHEHYRVREYALLMLNHWDPPTAWWHRLAVLSWQEPNKQVASLIYATITTMAKVNTDARRVEAVVKPASPNSLSNSHIVMYIKGNAQDMHRYWYDMVLSGNDDGLFPRMVKLYLRLGFLNQQFHGVRLSGHFDGTDVWKFFEDMFTSFEPDQSQEIVQEMYMEILEKLEMEPRFMSNSFDSHGFLTMFRTFETMYSINQEEEHFSPFSMTSMQMFINQQLFINTGRITTFVTTEVGTPLTIDITNPTFISTQSENFEIDIFDQGAIKMDTTVRIDSMKETHVKSLVPWMDSAVVAGLESRQELKLPFTMSGTLSISKKQLSIKFSPRDMDTENILLVSNTPYTVRTSLEFTPRFSSIDDYKEVVSGSKDQASRMWPLIPVTGLAMTGFWESDMQPMVNAHINNFFSGFYSMSSLSNIMRPTARKYKFLVNVDFQAATTKSWTFTFNYLASKQASSQVQDYSQMTQGQGGGDYSQYSQGFVDEYEDFGQFSVDAEISPGFEQTTSEIGKITEQFSFPSASAIYSIGFGLDFHGDDTRQFEMVLTWAQGFLEDNYGSKMQLTFYKGAYGMEMAHTTCLNAEFTMPYILPLTTIDELRRKDMATAIKLDLYSGQTCQEKALLTGKGELTLSSDAKEMFIKDGSVGAGCKADVDNPKHLDIPNYDRISVTTQWDDTAATKNIKTLWNRFRDIAHGSLFPFIISERVNTINEEKTFSFQAQKLGAMWQVNVTKESESTSIEQLYIPAWMEELVTPKRATDSVYESLITGQDGRPTCVITPDQVKTFDSVTFENHLDNCWVVAAMDCQQGRFVVQIRDSGMLEMRILWTERGFMFDITKEGVMVNGEPVESNTVTDNYRVFQDPEFALLQLTNLMAIKITETSFSISMRHSEKGSLCGICGNMDGEVLAEMEGPHGCVYSNTKDFITSWSTSGEGCNAFSLRGRMKPVNEYRESCPKLQYRSAARIFDTYASGIPCYEYRYDVINKDNYICTATQPSWNIMCDGECITQCNESPNSCRATQYPNNIPVVYRCQQMPRRGEYAGNNSDDPVTAGSKYPMPGNPRPRCPYYTTWNTQIAPDSCCNGKCSDAEHVTAIIGKSVVFNCPVSEPSKTYIIQWKKDSDVKINLPIFIRTDGYPPHVDDSYKGRLSLVANESSYGLASLQLRDVRKADQGWYECKILYQNQNISSVTGVWVHLEVHALM